MNALWRVCANMTSLPSSPRVGHWAAVRLVDGSIHRGVIYTVDPESRHLVLLRPPDDAAADAHAVRPMVLFADAIAQVWQDSSSGAAEALPIADVTLERLNPDGEADGCASDHMDAPLVERRRVALCALLRSQRAPFEEQPDGTLLILGVLLVNPPYTPRACRCENEIVLDRFLEMLATNPLPLSETHES